MRSISFEEAKRRYVHRYTMEHVPSWALQALPNGLYCAPQYSTDRQWYENTEFYGEGVIADKRHCFSTGQTWPLGNFLNRPYNR